MKCQDFAPRFLFLENFLILDLVAYVLFLIAVCIEGRWANLIEISFVRFLMMYSALFRHLMVTFTYAFLRFVNYKKNLEISEPLKGYLYQGDLC